MTFTIALVLIVAICVVDRWLAAKLVRSLRQRIATLEQEQRETQGQRDHAMQGWERSMVVLTGTMESHRKSDQAWLAMLGRAVAIGQLIVFRPERPGQERMN